MLTVSNTMPTGENVACQYLARRLRQEIDGAVALFDNYTRHPLPDRTGPGAGAVRQLNRPVEINARTTARFDVGTRGQLDTPARWLMFDAESRPATASRSARLGLSDLNPKQSSTRPSE